MDLFENPVGSLTSPAKCSAFYYFLAEVVLKLKFPNSYEEIIKYFFQIEMDLK